MGQTLAPMLEEIDRMDFDGDKNTDSKLLQFRQQLLSAIQANEDCTPILNELISLNCPSVMKYATINMHNLLLENNQNVEQLKTIPVGLNILEKYSKHLIKPTTSRNELWRYVKFSNQVYKERVEPLKGSMEIMRQMGYTDSTEDGLYFPSDREPDVKNTLNIIADIILAKREMEAYLTGTHPRAWEITKYLTPEAIQDVQRLQSNFSTSDLENKYLLSGVSLSQKFMEKSSAPVSAVHSQAGSMGQSVPGRSVSETSSVNQLTLNTPPPSQSSSGARPKPCDICAEKDATVLCVVCDDKHLCNNCDEMWHKHPKRQSHTRKQVVPEWSPDVPSNNINIQGPYGIKALPPNFRRSAASNVEKSSAAAVTTHSTSATIAAPSNLPNFDSLVQKSTDGSLDPRSLMDPNHTTMITTGPPNMPSGQPSTKPEIPDRRLKPAVYTARPFQTAFQSVYLPPEIPAENSSANSNHPTQPFVTFVSSVSGSGMSSAIPSSVPYTSAYNREFQASSQYQGYRPDGDVLVNTSHAKNTSDLVLSASGAASQQQQQQQHLHSSLQRSSSAAAQSHQGESPYSLRRTKSGAAAGSTTSKLLAKIMAIPDLEKRQSKCEVNILTLEEEMAEIEEELNRVVEEDENFHENLEFSTLNRKKGMLMREKLTLQKYKEEVDRMIQVRGSQLATGQTSDSQNVFYPPAVIANSSTSSVATNPLQSFSKPSYSGIGVSSEASVGKSSQGDDPQSMYFSCGPLQSSVHPPMTGQNLQQITGVPISSVQQHIPVSQQTLGPQQVPTSQHMPSQTVSNLTSQYPSVPRHLAQAYQQHRYYQQHMLPIRSQMDNKAPANASEYSQTNRTSQGIVGQVSEVWTTTVSSSVPSSTVCSSNSVVLQDPVTKVQETNIPASKVTAEQSVVSTQATTDKWQGSSETQRRGDTSQSTMSVCQHPTLVEGAAGFLYSWYCDHCTMINKAGTRVCHMCHKTSDTPRFVDEQPAGAGAGHTGAGAGHTDAGAGHAGEGHIDAGAGHTGAGAGDPSDSDETRVVEVGKKIGEMHDQIYYEKLEAHKKDQEMLQQEKEKKEKQVRRKRDEILSESAQKKHLDPNLSRLQVTEELHQSSCSLSTESEMTEQHSSSASLNSSGSDSIQGRQASFQEKMQYINEQRLMKQMHLDGADLVQFFKTCENAGHEFDVIEIAYDICNMKQSMVLDWLDKNWKPRVQMVRNRVKEEGQKIDQNDIGEISEEESESTLKDARGDVEEAVKKCIQTRTAMYAEINSDKEYPREEVLSAMFEAKGDVEHARQTLDCIRLQPLLDRIWNGALQHTDIADMTLDVNCQSVSTSVINHKEFLDEIKNKQIDLERRTRMVLVEARLQSWGRATTVLSILDNDLENMDSGYECTLEDIVEAVRNCGDRRSSIIYLQKECCLCFSKYPMSKMRSLNICQCQMCEYCFKEYFAITIREKNVRSWSCPYCESPDLEDPEVATDYIAFLCLLLQTLVDQDVLDLFETKIRDWHLQKDPNFRWCAHCGNGFLYQRRHEGQGRLDMVCPHCNKKTCFECKKQWADQHAGLNCQEYEQWTIDNDPKNQALGLAKHLEGSDIYCPRCNVRYSLAKGGCMHFKCPQCAYEFCSGCNQPFCKAGVCTKFRSCNKQGFHCHHPRDCFFYLRDFDVEELQHLLKLGKVDFNTVTPEGQQDREHCTVMEQKEGAYGHKDEACGRDVPADHAGLCINHYKEYLVGLINKKKQDPVVIMNIDEMNTLLDRVECKLPRPKKAANESDEAFVKKYREFVQMKVPLERN